MVSVFEPLSASLEFTTLLWGFGLSKLMLYLQEQLASTEDEPIAPSPEVGELDELHTFVGSKKQEMALDSGQSLSSRDS